MDKIKVSQVEDVTLWRRGTRLDGSLHLTLHHIVYRYVPAPPPGSEPPAKPPRTREIWITYPMISYCVYRPSPPASHQSPSIRIRGRDFTFFTLNFTDDKKARDVYDSIRSLSCKLGRLDKLLAFSYQPHPPEDKYNGWTIYDARREFKRLGISPKDSEKGWRITEINKDYKYSPTYPAVLAVPTKISDNVLNYAGNYRSRTRIPALVYRHPINNCSITRSSQPLPGIRGNRSPQDEKLVAAIFATNSGWRAAQSQAATPNPAGSSPDSSVVNLSESTANSSFVGVVDAEAVNSGRTTMDALTESSESEPELPKVYGAQQRNMIVDARPTVNAMAMQAVGLGSEKMEYYPGAQKAYLGIDNIHVMRKSLNTVVEALKDGDIVTMAPNRQLLEKSGWIKHIDNILVGTALIARTVGVMHSHVLIHCSDGWDRTSQLSALSQILLDPYYRTLEGFIVLVEKDWLSYGHMFRHRSGFLSSDKWFQIENERIERSANTPGGSNPFENALRGARGLFNRQNESNESLSQMPETNGAELQGQAVSDVAPGADGAPKSATTTIGAAEEHRITKVNELSPVFHQFLDATYQLLYQYPTRFEFNERFLRRLLYHLYSCQYGTFLFDNEKERVEARAAQRTRSVWDYFLSRKQEFLNPKYDPEVDDGVRGKERMIFPRKGETRWWAEVFGRQDDEMNLPVPSVLPPSHATLSPQTSNVSTGSNGTRTPRTSMQSASNGSWTPVHSGSGSGANTPAASFKEDVVTGTETGEQATGAGTTTHPRPIPAAAAFGRELGSNLSQNLAAGIASLGLGNSNAGSRATSPGRGSARRSVSQPRSRSPSAQAAAAELGSQVKSREMLEVEMQ